MSTEETTPNSRLNNNTLQQEYHTFDTANNLYFTSEYNFNLDDIDEDETIFTEYLSKQSTQSRFSLYSMRYIHKMSKLNKTLSTNKFTDTKQRSIYTSVGEIYRKCCFTAIGMKVVLGINIVLVALNVFLIIYEAVLLANESNQTFNAYYLSTNLPMLFFICDLIITVILIIEVLLHWYIGYMCHCAQYLCHNTCDNQIDMIVMCLSIVCCVLYVSDFDNAKDSDDLLFLGVRIVRDLIRIVRCYFFFKLLYQNLGFEFGEDIQRLNKGSDVCVTDLGELRALKSQKSQQLWDKYVKERELHPKATMLKVKSQSAVGTVMDIPEHHTINDDINHL